MKGRKGFIRYWISILVLLMTLSQVSFAKEKNYIETDTLTYGQDTLHFYKHMTSGLNVLWIENDDANRSFTLGVKTPTTDSTGVNHIIEHTLFTGSKKYPSSTVFFDASAQYPTLFMNALTSADLTLFPFCTPYENCYNQLVDIYMDSIFNPNMLNQPYSFYEESFYYNPQTDSYGGVVYNEMKGANADAGRNIYKALRKAFYEGTHYANDSGGSVEAIPTLSYESFVETYRNYYYPNNMFIVLYGDISINHMLKSIHEYVKNYPLTDKWVDVNVPVQKKDVPLELEYTSKQDHLTIIKGFLVEEPLSIEEELALDLWIQTYWADKDSMLRKRLKELGINQIDVVKDDGTQFPVYGIIVKDVMPYEKEKVSTFIEVAWKESLGYQDKAKEADILSNVKFSIKEAAQQGMRGITLSDSMIESWAHDEEYTSHFEKIQALEDLEVLNLDVKNIFKTNMYERFIYLTPKEGSYQSPLTDSPVGDESWEQMNEQMWEWQKENSNQALPKISPKQMLLETDFPKKIQEEKGTFLLTELESELVQTHIYQPVNHIAQEELPYLFIYTELLNNIAKEYQPFKGNMGARIVSLDEKEGEQVNYLDIHLVTEPDENTSELYHAFRQQLSGKSEEWYQKAIGDYELSLKEQLQADILGTLKYLNGGGQTGAKRYQYERLYPLFETIRGMDNSSYKEVCAKAIAIGGSIGLHEETTIGIAGAKEVVKEHKDQWEAYISQHKTEIQAYNKYHFTKNEPLNMYYQNTPVDYIVCTYDKGKDWVDGIDYVLAAYATHYYLQPNIRVEKGAYGAGMHAIYPNTLSVYTYRDPDYKSSLEIIHVMAEKLKGNLNGEKLEKVQVEALSNLQKQLKLLGTPFEKTSALEQLVLMGVVEKDILSLQKSILNTTPEDLYEKLMLLKYIIPKSQVGICTNKECIKKQISSNNYEIQ